MYGAPDRTRGQWVDHTHTDGRSRDIYGAPGWGKTHSNVLISKIEGRRSRPPAFMMPPFWILLGSARRGKNAPEGESQKCGLTLDWPQKR